MILRKATIDDIKLLIRCRIDYLSEDKMQYEGRTLTQDEISTFVPQLEKYLPKHINDNTFIGMLAEVDGNVVATAYLAITERPAGTGNNGTVGTFLNVLTYPEYRRQGIATKLINAVINEAKEAGVSFIELWSSFEGKPLYNKIGFTEIKYTLMGIKP